jgi:AcrR family transcriptional regulator
MTVVPRVRAERIEIRRSRDQILRAAEAHFEEHNAEPSMSDLAILAGIGNATLWRRFASIDEVIAALYDRMVERLQVVADSAFSRETGWGGVVALISGIAEVIETHPAIPRVTRKMVELNPSLRHGAQWEDEIEAVSQRAQEEGMLRADVCGNDLTLAAFRMGEYVYLPKDARGRVIARQVVIVLDGLRADGQRTPMPGEGISTDEIQGFFRHEMR